LGLADPYAAEIAARAGFDWLLIDGEHAANDIRSLSAQRAVIEGKGPGVGHDQLDFMGFPSGLIPDSD
jgi:2-keto-3-deoxy-L-rhamnonate aldolase RhmA